MRKVKHTASFNISQPIHVLFPLFSAEGEKHWVPGWDYKNISEGTELHEDYIFLTKAHDHATTDAIWVVKKYDPEKYYVQFYKVEAGDKVGIIEIKCIELSESCTEVQVTYEYIGLSHKGNQFIEKFSSSDYEVFISEWKTLLEIYFDK